MSKTFVPSTLMACFVKTEDYLGDNRVWSTVNADQALFIGDYFNPSRGQLTSFSDQELETAIDWDHETLNAFLEDRGFPGKFEPFDSDTFGAAAVLKVLVEWLAEGTETEVTHDGVDYPAFNIIDGVSILKADCHDHPIARIETKTGDVAFLTIHDELSGFELDRRISEIENAAQPCFDFDGLTAPCVDLEDEPDVSYLIGMNTTSEKVRAGQRATVTQAFQINRLKMNRFGAKVESAAGVAVSLESCISIPNPPLVIDQPFIIWFRRPGLDVPVLEAYVSTDDWSDPGDLDA